MTPESNGNVLVIDDLEDWRQVVGGLLQDAGYDVKMAGDQDEAMRLLRARPYHVAIVDMRLDERDEQDRSGLNLAVRMKEHAPELSIIILTAYPALRSAIDALQPSSNGDRLAYAYLEKAGIEHLLPKVEQALHNDARVNPHLEIVLEHGLDWRRIQNSIECLLPQEATTAAEELSDLLKRVFCQADRIALRPLKNGHSGSAVLLVTPFSRDIEQASVVVKLTERSNAEREAEKYDKYVANHMAEPRRTDRRDVRVTARLGAIVYSFVGAGATDFLRFRDVYNSGDRGSIQRVIENLFADTCSSWYRRTLRPAGSIPSLGGRYREWLRLDNDKIELALRETMALASECGMTLIDSRRPLASGIRVGDEPEILDNPIAISTSPLPYHGMFCYAHGDLHEDNILVDSHQQTWLIDFFNTGPAHPVRDFALLECAIRLYLQRSTGALPLFYRWEQNLAGEVLNPDGWQSDPQIVDDVELDRATEAILQIRRLLRRLLPEMTARDYLIGLYFHALKAMTLTKKFTPHQRCHALLSAAVLATALGTHK